MSARRTAAAAVGPARANPAWCGLRRGHGDLDAADGDADQGTGLEERGAQRAADGLGEPGAGEADAPEGGQHGIVTQPVIIGNVPVAEGSTDDALANQGGHLTTTPRDGAQRKAGMSGFDPHMHKLGGSKANCRSRPASSSTIRTPTEYSNTMPCGPSK